jgi:uncharacterized protein YtpQ (UPF0354 family)
MKRILLVLAVVSGLLGCSHSGIESREKFTEEYATGLQSALPDVTVKITGPLEVHAVGKAGGDITCFLSNAYTDYQATPANKADIIKRYTESFVESFHSTATSDAIDTTRIVPVIKDKAYLQEVRDNLRARGADVSKMNQVSEDYNSELVIVYAEDTPTSMRFFNADDLKKTGLQISDLRPLAVTNLLRLVPDIKIEGSDGTYMVTAGGDYEACLVLARSLWEGGRMKVEGDYVVAIPTRDLLLVTGSGNKAGVQKLREIAAKTVKEASHSLTPLLFVYRDGTFQVYNE